MIRVVVNYRQKFYITIEKYSLLLLLLLQCTVSLLLLQCTVSLLLLLLLQLQCNLITITITVECILDNDNNKML